MRDKDRIKPFLEKLEEYWLSTPDLRFGQIMYTMLQKLNYKSLNNPDKSWNDGFNVEDDVWYEIVDIMSKNTR